MNIYGIIAAMQEEMEEIQKKMINIKTTKIYDLKFIEGKISGVEIVLVEAGVGKVNAARTTQVLIDKFSIDSVINIGSAGAANDKLNIGDIVIGSELVQHDFDITAFGHPKGFVSNVGLYLESDEFLIKQMRKTIEEMNNRDFNILIGTIASGDIFCTELKMKDKIRDKFSADAIEMEGAAIAQVCKLDNIPFIVVRGISDSPNGNNEVTFEQYLKKASQRCAQIIEEFLLKLDKTAI